MLSAWCNVLTLMYWRAFRFYDDLGSRDFTWLLIGAALAVLVMWVISRRRRRWF